jgi:predicted nucleotidyltransferase
MKVELADSALSALRQARAEFVPPFQRVKDDLAFLANDPDLEMAMIFGSTVSGNAKPDSDIDVAVYPRHPLDHQAVQRLSDQIALATGRPVDVVDLSSSDGALLRQILRSGKVLFSKHPGILGILAERLLAWQEDFEPALNALLAARLKRFTSPLHGS